jgi:hypothetical protein
MLSTETRILVVGATSSDTSALLTGLATRGLGSHCVDTVREAQDVLETFPFEIVLAAESLADGRGYELAGVVTRNWGTLLVGVALSESCLWLPVVERGANVLGKRALNANMLESELSMLLCARTCERRPDVIRDSAPASTRPALQRTLSPRRKISAASSAIIPRTSSAKPATDRRTALAIAAKEARREISHLRASHERSPEPLHTRPTGIETGVRRPPRPH